MKTLEDLVSEYRMFGRKSLLPAAKTISKHCSSITQWIGTEFKQGLRLRSPLDHLAITPKVPNRHFTIRKSLFFVNHRSTLLPVWPKNLV